MTALPPTLQATLTSLVNTALANLDLTNPTQKAIACAALSSFSTAVQRAGALGLLPAATAANLEAEANQIRGAIGC